MREELMHRDLLDVDDFVAHKSKTNCKIRHESRACPQRLRHVLLTIRKIHQISQPNKICFASGGAVRSRPRTANVGNAFRGAGDRPRDDDLTAVR